MPVNVYDTYIHNPYIFDISLVLRQGVQKTKVRKRLHYDVLYFIKKQKDKEILSRFMNSTRCVK